MAKGDNVAKRIQGISALHVTRALRRLVDPLKADGDEPEWPTINFVGSVHSTLAGGGKFIFQINCGEFEDTETHQMRTVMRSFECSIREVAR